MNMQLVLNILLTNIFLLLVSYSFTLTYYPARFFHIAHAATITFAAYFTYFFSQQHHCPVVIAVPAAILSATLIGMFSEITLYKPLRRRNASPMILMLASLGLYTVLQNVISLLWGDDTKSIRIGEVKVGHEFFGAYITDIQIITITRLVS